MRPVENMPLQSRLLVSHDFHRNAPQADASFKSSISCYRGKVFMLVSPAMTSQAYCPDFGQCASRIASALE